MTGFFKNAVQREVLGDNYFSHGTAHFLFYDMRRNGFVELSFLSSPILINGWKSGIGLDGTMPYGREAHQ
jgi:hypothetical protein